MINLIVGITWLFRLDRPRAEQFKGEMDSSFDVNRVHIIRSRATEEDHLLVENLYSLVLGCNS